MLFIYLYAVKKLMLLYLAHSNQKREILWAKHSSEMCTTLAIKFPTHSDNLLVLDVRIRISYAYVYVCYA